MALWVHCLFFCANCLACSHSVTVRHLHTQNNNQVADCEFFRAQASHESRSERPLAFPHLKKCSELLIGWQRSHGGPEESGVAGQRF